MTTKPAAVPTHREHAQALDRDDPLTRFRDAFHLPQHQGEDAVYLCGNSLGLMPKDAARILDEELDSWRTRAVDGHFEGPRPWYAYHKGLADGAAHIVGCAPHEVVIMNSLTVNLHLMMVSFYRPTPERYKILIEDNAFPSDRYAVQSQVRVHGFDPDAAVVVMRPRAGEDALRTEDIETYLDEHGDAVALVLFGGVNFYSGQAYDLPRITEAAHRAGALCGFDLAHAAGNLALRLHDWNVDFAPFCTYKYLNAGPGASAGCFVHERHAKNVDLLRFAGWWGNDPSTRFLMADDFKAAPSADGWQISNAPVFSMAPLYASFGLFQEAGMPALRKKSEALTGYLAELLAALPKPGVDVITPSKPVARGCQLSLRVPEDAKGLRDKLQARGVICDYRAPDVLRIAPVPLYNRFDDVWRFAHILEELLNDDTHS